MDEVRPDAWLKDEFYSLFVRIQIWILDLDSCVRVGVGPGSGGLKDRSRAHMADTE